MGAPPLSRDTLQGRTGILDSSQTLRQPSFFPCRSLPHALASPSPPFWGSMQSASKSTASPEDQLATFIAKFTPENQTFIRSVRGGGFGPGMGLNSELGGMQAEVKDCGSNGQ